MDFVAKHISELEESLTLSITSQANQMKADGEDICSFGAGEPDLDTPDYIKQAAIDALNDGKTKYTASSGIPELRKRIAKKLKDENGLHYDWKDVSVNCGAKHSCYNALLATIDPEDEVIIPAPYWTSYPEMVKMVGGVPVIVHTKMDKGYKITPEQFEDAMSPKTKMIILNTPNNPTGAVYSKDELAALGEVAASEDILILSDEIYEKLVYGETEHVSIGSLSDELQKLTITINGFSKCYAMTGWRLGYTAAPEGIAKAIDTIQSHSTSNATSFAQYGGLAALDGDPLIIADMTQEFDMRRQYMLQRFNAIANIRVIEPQGAFYYLVDIGQMGLKSVNFAEKLLSRMKVALVPGVAFGDDNTVRLSYACGLDVIKEGLDRFETFCKSH
ncbi:MAG: aspartate aminotransferase [Verrucomicrobiales bacterium]|jgi:aspartate aminotransferase